MRVNVGSDRILCSKHEKARARRAFGDTKKHALFCLGRTAARGTKAQQAEAQQCD